MKISNVGFFKDRENEKVKMLKKQSEKEKRIATPEEPIEIEDFTPWNDAKIISNTLT